MLEGTPTQGNIFYQLCPSLLLTPLVVLATFATIIASQSIITGAVPHTKPESRYLSPIQVSDAEALGH